MRSSRMMRLALAAFLLATTAPAFAQGLSGSTSDATGSSCSGTNNTDGSCSFSRAAQTNTAAQFKSRYAWNINADVSSFNTRDTSGSSTHHVNVTATAPGGYRLDISTQRTGDMNRVTDIVNCDGSADTSAVTGTSNVALSSGSISLGDPGIISNGSGDTNTPFNQTSSAIIFRVSNSAAQAHNLTFTWTGAVRSNSCEAAVRQGESVGSTSGCGACEYPGSPSRTQLTDGHFVTVSFTSLCGNATVDGAVSEQCDLGSTNGAFGSCCTSTCQFVTAGTACRNAAGECDLQETCSGTNGSCPADAKKTSGTACTSDGLPCTLDECNGTGNDCQHPAGNGGATCRAAAGFCDLAETCTGTSTACPTDAFKGIVLCRAAVDVCDQLENCPPPGFGVDCPADIKKVNGVACTSDGNPCTVDQCNGVSDACQHPAGNTGGTCRAAAGGCDVAETCDGTANCPADTLASSGATCRGAASICDVAETCDGVSTACPANAFAAATVTCRAAADVCDLAENCTGGSASCPTDLIQSNGTSCSDGSTCTTGDTCQNGECTGTPTLETCLDDFLCYKSRVTSGTLRFSPIPSIHLVDKFEDQNFRVLKPKNLCTPADKHEGNGIVDANTHLVSYKIRAVAGVHVRRVNLPVSNLLGTIHVDTIRPDLLFVPAGKDLLGPPADPPFNSHAVDHYKCYKVRVTRGTAKFLKTPVDISDQFISPQKTLELKKPRHLCMAVDKNGDLRKNPNSHLLCYLARVQRGQPKFTKRVGLYTHDQFGNLRLDASKEREVCIPSSQSPSGAFLDALDD